MSYRFKPNMTEAEKAQYEEAMEREIEEKAKKAPNLTTAAPELVLHKQRGQR